MQGQVVKSLAVSSIEPGVAYAGTKPPYLFVSGDGGDTWTEQESLFARTKRKMKLESLLVNENRKMLAVVLLAWSGSLVHDQVEFGRPLPESTLLNLAIFGSLYLLWRQYPQQCRMISYLMMVWSALNILGAIISVYPFAFLPFYPDQTIEHYGVHIYYGLAQLPLLWVVGRQLRREA